MNNAVATFNNHPFDLLLTEMNEICLHEENPMLIQFRKKISDCSKPHEPQKTLLNKILCPLKLKHVAL